ncbi:ganglioside GM2 activator-like isoform X2 [Gigantopelta aegis]|uniref:ganglioside GM2 activator-like isoform X2 n=1 Tax=Gigantopelta aegis TaxID=1735272 RepID=UPI001B88C818|nr:ganglioside GM2 activator-like isoform X2 [Gigantopelta aegis]
MQWKAIKDKLLFEKKQTPKATRMLGFTYNPCPGHPQGTAVVKSLDFEPNPLVFPGPLTVSFYVENDMTLTSKLAANVTLIRATSVGNLTLPCIANIGSCNYDDICSMINPPVCPPPFVAAKIPCRCPFPKGIYDFRKGTTFDVGAAVFPPGQYYARINLTLMDKKPTFVACYDISVSFG